MEPNLGLSHSWLETTAGQAATRGLYGSAGYIEVSRRA